MPPEQEKSIIRRLIRSNEEPQVITSINCSNCHAKNVKQAGWDGERYWCKKCRGDEYLNNRENPLGNGW